MIEEYLAQNESKTLEFKENTRSLAGVVKTVIAFANTSGVIKDYQYHIEAENAQWKAKMVFDWMNLQKEKDSIELIDASGHLMVSIGAGKE